MDIMNEQKNDSSNCSGQLDSDFLLAMRMQEMENERFQREAAPADPAAADDELIARYLQEIELQEQSSPPACEGRHNNQHEKVKVQTLSSVLLSENKFVVSDPVHSSAWLEAQHLERKAHLRVDPSSTANKHNDLSSFSRHEPLLRALRSSELVSELEGGGDVSGSCLLLNKSVAQEMRSFVKKQRKQEKHKTKKRASTEVDPCGPAVANAPAPASSVGSDSDSSNNISSS